MNDCVKYKLTNMIGGSQFVSVSDSVCSLICTLSEKDPRYTQMLKNFSKAYLNTLIQVVTVSLP